MAEAAPQANGLDKTGRLTGLYRFIVPVDPYNEHFSFWGHVEGS
jgi:hypothetical protein